MEIIKDDPKMISMETLKSRINSLNMYMCTCITRGMELKSYEEII